MKMKKGIKLLLIAAFWGATTALAVGCNLSIGGAQQEDVFTGFLKGYKENVEIGSELRPKEYVDVVSDSDYTIVLSKADGTFSEDVTRSRGFNTATLTPGAYKLTYTIAGGEYAGTYVCEFSIVAPKLKVQFTLAAENMEAQLGTTLNFEEYLQSLEWKVTSYYDYVFRPDYVWVGEDKEVDLTGMTEYTFADDEQHAFHFTVVAEDGQEFPLMIPIDAVKASAQAQAFMTENNVAFYKYNEIDEDLRVNFKAGFSRGGSNNRQDLGYMAYKGNYGAGNYVKVDFTGNNLPKVAFFASEVIGKLNDGTKGVYVGNGHWHEWKKWQYDQNEYTVYGPNKVEGGYFSPSSDDGLWSEKNVPIAGAELEKSPETKYTYYVGVRETKDASQVAEGETPYMILECLLINRDTNETVYHCDQKIESADFRSGYFTGNILVYANFGYETTYDKVYPLQQAATVMEFDRSPSQMKADAPVKTTVEDALATSAFADISAGDVLGYIKADAFTDALLVQDEDGKTTINTAHAGFIDVSNEDEFLITQAGEYVVYYQKAGTYAPASSALTVTLALAPLFNENAPTKVGFDETLTPAAFATVGAGGLLGYIQKDNITDALLTVEANGQTRVNTAHVGFVDVTSETSFTMAVGEYVVYYQETNKLQPATMELTVYNPFYVDFEDGVNNIITTTKNDTCELVGPQAPTATVPIATTNNALKYDPGDWDFNIGFDLSWLQRMFAATEATGVQFKVYTDKQWANIQASGSSLTAFQLYNPNGGCQVWSGYTWEDKGDYLLVTLSKTAIENYIALNAASATPATVMVLSMRLGVLDTAEGSATNGKIVWGACDFVYLDDFEAAMPENA